jgi:hypothetical protein
MKVTCPICKQKADWQGCSRCDDDYGPLVCHVCGSRMPAVSLSELETSTSPDFTEPVEGEACLLAS